MPCRPVGVLEMHDEAGQDEKILCVPHDDPTWTRVSDAGDVRPELLAEIKHFFEVYKDLEAGKHVTVGEWEGREQAIEAWGRGHDRWRQQRGVTLQGTWLRLRLDLRLGLLVEAA